MKTAVEVAQEIVDSVTDIRPEYLNKRVVSVSVNPPTEALRVVVLFEDGTTTSFVGLWAKEIVRHLPDDLVL